MCEREKELKYIHSTSTIYFNFLMNFKRLLSVINCHIFLYLSFISCSVDVRIIKCKIISKKGINVVRIKYDGKKDVDIAKEEEKEKKK